MNDRLEPELKALIEEGRRKGYVTYDEVHRMLPDEMTSSEEKLDKLAQLLDEMQIELLEEARTFESVQTDEDNQAPPRSKVRPDDLEPKSSTLDPLTMQTPVERIDDPVRMYLTQMGEIPLLTRKEEIWLARSWARADESSRSR